MRLLNGWEILKAIETPVKTYNYSAESQTSSQNKKVKQFTVLKTIKLGIEFAVYNEKELFMYKVYTIELEQEINDYIIEYTFTGNSVYDDSQDNLNTSDIEHEIRVGVYDTFDNIFWVYEGLQVNDLPKNWPDKFKKAVQRAYSEYYNEYVDYSVIDIEDAMADDYENEEF